MMVRGGPNKITHAQEWSRNEHPNTTFLPSSMTKGALKISWWHDTKRRSPHSNAELMYYLILENHQHFWTRSSLQCSSSVFGRAPDKNRTDRPSGWSFKIEIKEKHSGQSKKMFISRSNHSRRQKYNRHKTLKYHYTMTWPISTSTRNGDQSDFFAHHCW